LEWRKCFKTIAFEALENSFGFVKRNYWNAIKIRAVERGNICTAALQR